MKFLHDILHKQKPLFEKGGKFEKFYYLFEAGESFMFTPETTTPLKGTQVRDAIDLKRLMMTVVIALVPALLFGIWNVGHQHFLATGEGGELIDKILLGMQVVLPIVLVSYSAGGIVEAIFAIARKHPINEGFLVTGMLIPLVLPPTIPLWQVAVATIFAVLIAKETFGGTGMNLLNIALTARAFLYFAYPIDISGEVWTYLGDAAVVDGYTGATPLAIAANAQSSVIESLTSATANWVGAVDIYSMENLFLGMIPGSIGETSVLMALIGAVILLITGVASWRIMLSAVVGALLMGAIASFFGGSMSPADYPESEAIQKMIVFMQLPAYYHLLIGGFAFGVVFMATDPVSAAQTSTGKWIYGFLIGVLTIIIRVFNPAYPEGIMLAILLMNVFAPLIDYYVVESNKKRRIKRATL
jgi:Na+-transporting NADH:ubiquinone oxidoreductase subunit B